MGLFDRKNNYTLPLTAGNMTEVEEAFPVDADDKPLASFSPMDSSKKLAGREVTSGGYTWHAKRVDYDFNLQVTQVILEDPRGYVYGDRSVTVTDRAIINHPRGLLGILNDLSWNPREDFMWHVESWSDDPDPPPQSAVRLEDYVEIHRAHFLNLFGLDGGDMTLPEMYQLVKDQMDLLREQANAR